MNPESFDKLHGFYFEQLEVGMSASVERVIGEEDVAAFAGLSGDTNPLHLDDDFARRTRVGERVVHGMVTASLISTLVGCRLPGPGCLWMGQTLRFLKPVRVGERVKASAEVVEVLQNKQRVRLRTTCQVGTHVVIDGEALVWVPVREDERVPGRR